MKIWKVMGCALLFVITILSSAIELRADACNPYYFPWGNTGSGTQHTLISYMCRGGYRPVNGACLVPTEWSSCYPLTPLPANVRIVGGATTYGCTYDGQGGCLGNKYVSIISEAVYWVYANNSNPLPNGDMGPAAPINPCSSEGKGSPVWQVNKVNMNLYVTDTPVWYKPAIGPTVELVMSYNSQAVVAPYAPFGNKWTFNYASYLTIGTDGSVTVNMPDGRLDVFTSPDNQGVYTKPFGVFNALIYIDSNHYRLTFPDGTVYDYDTPAGSGLITPSLAAITDPHGLSLTFSYQNGYLTTITDAQGKVTTLNYYPNGLVQNVTDPFGRYTSFEYDANRNLTSATDMGGYQTTYTYDANGHSYLAGITNPKGTWGFYIEPNDNATNADIYPAPGAPMGSNYRITITDPLGHKEEYFYYGKTNYVSPRDYVAYVDATTNNLTKAMKTSYLLDTTMPKAKISKIMTPEGRTTTFTYDYNATTHTGTGNIATVADGNGHTIKYGYNSLGLVTSIWDAKTPTSSQPTTSIGYDPNNNIDVLTVTNGLGTINNTYNSMHDITRVIDRMGYETDLAYNSFGQPSAITEAKGTSAETLTELIYDPTGNTLSEIRKAGVTVSAFTYDNIGRVQTETRSDGSTISYSYDNLDQKKTVLYPDGRTETITNSTLCPFLVDSITDRANRTTNFTYDALKRLIQKDGPDGTFKYGYNNNGNMTTFTDPGNKVTTFGYDLDNNVTKKTYADGKYVSYIYDSAGLLKITTNSRFQSIQRGYDENNNLISLTYPYGMTNVTMTYDAYNRLATRTDAIGTFKYSYDADNRLTDVTYPWDGTTSTVHYDYNALGQLTAMTPLGGSAVGYTYDSLGRLKTIQRSIDSMPFVYDYEMAIPSSPLVQQLTRPNGSYTQYSYDPALPRLTAINNMNSIGQVINSYSYTYNALTNPDLRDTETINNGTPVLYTYDNADQLLSGSSPNNTYAYDPSGNMTTRNLITYSINTVNQVTASTNPSRTYAYDNDGNMTTGYNPDGKTLTMTYDAENRLTSAQYTDSTGKVQKTTYDYTGDSLLAVMKKYVNSVLTTTTRYVRAGFLPIQERDANNLVTREYLWGSNQGGGIGGLLNLRQNGNDYNYLYDGKGNVTALIDVNQNSVATYSYDPFGNLLTKTGTLDQPFMFSTKQYDTSTGLYYYGFRFYSPTLGRWINRDPLGEEGGINLYGFVDSVGKPRLPRLQPNLYLYSHNNPVNFIDPLGLYEGLSGYGGEADHLYNQDTVGTPDNYYGLGGLLAAPVLIPTGEISCAVVGARVGLTAIGMGFINWMDWAINPSWPPKPEPKFATRPLPPITAPLPTAR